MRGGVVLFSFAGLPGATLVGIFSIVGLLTLGLYFLKLRRRRVQVPFVELWESLLGQEKASAWRTRLQRFLSLLLSLLLVAALVLALGDPRADNEQEKARSLVIVLDVSASMGIKAKDRSRLDLAREKIRTWISSLGSGDEVLLIEMGARSRPLDTFIDSKERLTDLVNGTRLTDSSANLQEALTLAQDALRGREHGRIIVVSDGALELPPEPQLAQLPDFYFEPVFVETQGGGGNIALTAFSARRTPIAPDRFEVLAEVENSGDDVAEVELALFEADAAGLKGALLDLHRMQVDGGERISKIYENLDQAQEGLIAEVSRVDGVSEELFNDNIARTLLSPRRALKVLLVGQPNTFVEAALSIDESLEISSVSSSGYPPAGEFDLTIFDGAFPRRSAQTGAALYLGLPNDDEDDYPVEVGEPINMFGFDTWKKDSKVFYLLDPYNVQVLSGAALRGRKGDTELAYSKGKSIFIQGAREEGRFLALGFSPHLSDFVMRAVWPLFLLNVVEELAPRGGVDVSLGVQTGQTWRVPAAVDSQQAILRGPYILGSGGSTQKAKQDLMPTYQVPISDGQAIFFGSQAGFYDVVGQNGTIRFAASMLSSGESRLLPTKKLMLGEREIQPAPQMVVRSSKNPWFWILLGVFCVSFIEWWMYHRRWTV